MRAVIFLNGDPPHIRLIKRYVEKLDFIVAADGASNYLRSLNIMPDIIIGDMDSTSRSTAKFFGRKEIPVIEIKEQETTDFEKSLMFCLKNGLKNILVFGAVSTRTDHTINNFSIMKKYFNKAGITFVTAEFEIFLIRKQTEFSVMPGETLSLMALPKASGITTKGLMYSLNNEILEFGKREGTLNKTVSNKVSISFKTGYLLLFKKNSR